MSCILTARLDGQAQAFFDHLRQKHFPASRNLIAAHLTLFHQLPDSAETVRALQDAASIRHPFELKVTGLRSLGRGVAYTISSPLLLDLHRELAETFAEELIPQDKQRFMPHIVVQNKVTGEQARALLAELQNGFVPMMVEVRGMELWEYLGGPWKHLETFEFA